MLRCVQRCLRGVSRQINHLGAEDPSERRNYHWYESCFANFVFSPLLKAFLFKYIQTSVDYLFGSYLSFSAFILPDIPSFSSYETGKSMAIQNKQRAVVVVRKALDKLLADLEKVFFVCV